MRSFGFAGAFSLTTIIAGLLYGQAGQKVATLARGERSSGSHAVKWDGRDDEGRELATGVYLYRLRLGTQVETRKLLLLR